MLLYKKLLLMTFGTTLVVTGYGLVATGSRGRSNSDGVLSNNY